MLCKQVFVIFSFSYFFLFAQDVDTIYLSQNCKDINLTDFELTDSK